MPRRKATTSSESDVTATSSRRSTRGAVVQAAAGDETAPAGRGRGRGKEPVQERPASPALKAGRGRGKKAAAENKPGRGRRGKAAAKEEEEEDDDAEEEMAVTEDAPAEEEDTQEEEQEEEPEKPKGKKGRGRARASSKSEETEEAAPVGRRGRAASKSEDTEAPSTSKGRGRAKKQEAEPKEDEGVTESPAKGRRGRGSQASTSSGTAARSSRRGRGAKDEAEEETDSQEQEGQESEEPIPEEPGSAESSRKRKRSGEDDSQDDITAEESPEAAKKTKVEETHVVEEEKVVEDDEPKQVMAAVVEEQEPMEVDSADSAAPEAEAKEETPAGDYVIVNKEDVPAPDSAEVRESLPKFPSPAKATAPEQQEEPETPPVAETTDSTPTVPTDEPVIEKSSEVDQATSETPGLSVEETVAKEYVVVDKRDVPPPDSPEVTQSLPKFTSPVRSAEPESPVKEAVQSPVKEAVQSPVKEEVQSPVKEVVQSPVKEAVQVPVEEAVVHSPVKEAAAPSPVKEAAPISVLPMTQSSESMEVEAPISNSSSAESLPSVEEPPATVPDIDTSTQANGNNNGNAHSGNSRSLQNGSSVDSPAANHFEEKIVGDVDILLHRQFVKNPLSDPSVSSEKHFTVASYNILADCHAKRTPYPWLSARHLSMDFRHKRLMQEFRFLDSDVLCLQEVDPDYFKDVLLPAMKGLGFGGVHMKRVESHYHEGEATFYRESKFTLLEYKGMALRDLAFKELEAHASGMEPAKLAAVKEYVNKPAVVLMTQLRSNTSGHMVTVANIHVSWEQLQKPDLQCIEVSSAIRALVTLADGPTHGHIICGDFNSWAGSPVYQLTKEGYLDDESMTALQGCKNVFMPDGTKSPLVNLWWRGFQHTSNNLSSAYNTVLGREPLSTRYANTGLCRPVDLIWHGGMALGCAGVLDAVPEVEKRLKSPGVPNETFPSDHLSVKAQLYFK